MSFVHHPGAAQGRHLLFFVTEDWYFVSHRLPLAVAARDAGYRVTVVTKARAHGEVIRSAGLRLLPFENVRTRLNPVAELYTLARLILLYRRERPDVVHHVAMKPVLYGSIAALCAGGPHVVNAIAGRGWLFTATTAVGRGLQLLVRGALKRLLASGVTLVQNPDDVQFLAQMGIPRERIRCIPGTGVDLTQFRPRPEPPGIPVVLLPARLLWEKGVAEFVEAARKLHARGMAAHFVLAGDPDDLNPGAVPGSALQRWIAEGVVQHLGWVEDMAALMSRCHIVCLPSYAEGLPKALAEAAAAGRPIVTTIVPGCREVVRHGDNGLLVPPRDPEALVAALAQLIADPVLRARMGARGRSLAERLFDLDAINRRTIALYAEDA